MPNTHAATWNFNRSNLSTAGSAVGRLPVRSIDTLTLTEPDEEREPSDGEPPIGFRRVSPLEHASAIHGSAGSSRPLDRLIDRCRASSPGGSLTQSCQSLCEEAHMYTIVPVEVARYIASQIPTGRAVELAGVGHLAFGSGTDLIGDEVERFLKDVWEAGGWEEAEPDRVLATVLFTDIVGSTAKATELGDRAWRELLARHHSLIRRELVRFRGTELDVAGDGFFASFNGPARAVRCACAITENIRELGVEVRAGLHTGECEVLDGKVGGIAVHIGARVAKEAQPSEVLVSSTVKDLVAGSEIRFRERGTAALKGVPEEWRLYAVQRGDRDLAPRGLMWVRRS
jgi:class 3 adenylate cyclase